MFLLALVALLSVAAGDPTLKCRPTGLCKCDVEGLASGPAEIDLRSIFEGGSLQTTVENVQVTYTYNGCHAQACGAHQESTMAICQTTGNISFGLGQLQNVSFDISGSDPTTNYWLIVATYRNGDTDDLNRTRVSQVRFFYNETFSVPRFHFEEEDRSQPTYFFTVHSNAVIPRRAVASTTSFSVWIIVGPVILALVLIIAAVGVAVIIIWSCHKHRRGYLRLQGAETPAAIQRQQQQMSIDGTMKWTLLSNAS